MKKSWFAGNFCPVGAECSISEELRPTKGPAIREMALKTPGAPFIAEIKQFSETPPKGEIEWMKAEG